MKKYILFTPSNKVHFFLHYFYQLTITP